MVVIVSGNWGNTSNAGVCAVNANNYRSNSNSNYGFRCSDHCFRLMAHKGVLEQ